MLRPYRIVRDWVDRQWRAPGMQWKILLFPAVLPLLLAAIAGAGPSHLPYGFAWLGLWSAFVFWRFWFYLRETSVAGDRDYDEAGKYRLSKDYHDTESATAAAERRRRERD